MFAWTLSGYEIIIIAVIALLLFGTRLPAVGRSFGSAIVQFRRALSGTEETPEDSESSKKPGVEAKR